MFRDKHPRSATKGEKRPIPASVQLHLPSIPRLSRMSCDGSCLCNLKKNRHRIIPKPLVCFVLTELTWTLTVFSRVIWSSALSSLTQSFLSVSSSCLVLWETSRFSSVFGAARTGSRPPPSSCYTCRLLICWWCSSSRWGKWSTMQRWSGGEVTSCVNCTTSCGTLDITRRRTSCVASALTGSWHLCSPSDPSPSHPTPAR